MAKGMTCTCGPSNFGWMILAAVLFAIGLYFVVWGVYTQWTGGDWLTAMVWSAIGFLVFMLGKMAKWKAYCCPAHAMN